MKNFVLQLTKIVVAPFYHYFIHFWGKTWKNSLSIAHKSNESETRQLLGDSLLKSTVKTKKIVCLKLTQVKFFRGIKKNKISVR